MKEFPLQWPTGFPRASVRKTGQFKTTLFRALENVKDSLRRFGDDSKNKVTDIILSSNVTLGVQNPKDPGVAAWFMWDNNRLCIAVDIYEKVEDNLQAIHHIIEARRTELRHGGLHIVRQTFMGFKALASGKREWWTVLEVSPTASPDEIKKAFRDKSLYAHPDRGGSHEKMAELNEAYDTANKK